MSDDDRVITQTGKVRLVRAEGGYVVEAPDGNVSHEKFLPAYFDYLDSIGWSDKR